MYNVLLGYLLLLNVFVYVLGKAILYYELFMGRIRFSFQNQFDPSYRNDFHGYISAMAILTWWPLTASRIKLARRRT